MDQSDTYNNEDSNNLDNKANNYSDSDDDECLIGDTYLIPSKWYEYEDHCGYDKEGNRILKQSDISSLKKFISGSDDDIRTIRDQFGNVLATLTDADLQLIKRITKRQYPNEGYDPESLHVEYRKEDDTLPTKSRIYRKDSFMPSKHEMKIIKKIVKAIKKSETLPSMIDESSDNDIWKDSIYSCEDKYKRRIIHDLSAPKMPLPKSDESYNPPDDLISSDAPSEDRRYLPKRYTSLRHVPSYKYHLIERFERCMELYLCPRATRVRMNIDVNALLGSIPRMDSYKLDHDVCVDYRFSDSANVIRIDHTGMFVLIAGSSKFHVYNLLSGRCCFEFVSSGDEPIKDIIWHPYLPVIAICQGVKIVLLAIQFYIDSCRTEHSDFSNEMPCGYTGAIEYLLLEKNKRITFGETVLRWKKQVEGIFDESMTVGLTIYHHAKIRNISFHHKGHYIACTVEGGTRISDQVIVHSISKKSSQFLKAKGSNIRVYQAKFHPTEPQLILGTCSGLRIINLRSSEPNTVKLSGLSEVLNLDVSNNVLIASGDGGSVSFYDLQDPASPFKSLIMPSVNQVIAHKSSSLVYLVQSNGKINVFYIRTDSDSLSSILPCKQIDLRSSGGINGLAVHPTKSWFVTSGINACHLYA